MCRPPSCCLYPLGCGVPVSLSASKGSTPGAAGAVRDSRNRHARPVADPVRLVQYCGRPGTSLRSLRSWLLAVEFHQLLTKPPDCHLRSPRPSVSSPKSEPGTSRTALVFLRSWKLSMLRLGDNPGLCLEELLWRSPDPAWHAIQRACKEFSVPASVRPELLSLGCQHLEDKVCFVPEAPESTLVTDTVASRAGIPEPPAFFRPRICEAWMTGVLLG